MLIARLVKVSDSDRLFKLTKTGGRGLTTMPKSKEELADRIKWSIKSATSSKNLLTMIPTYLCLRTVKSL